MTGIVERLRVKQNNYAQDITLRQAAENGQLRAEIERQRAALEIIAGCDVDYKSGDRWINIGKIARAALEPKP